MKGLHVHVRSDAVGGAASQGPLLDAVEPVAGQVVAKRPGVRMSHQALHKVCGRLLRRRQVLVIHDGHQRIIYFLPGLSVLFEMAGSRQRDYDIGMARICCRMA